MFSATGRQLITRGCARSFCLYPLQQACPSQALGRGPIIVCFCFGTALGIVALQLPIHSATGICHLHDMPLHWDTRTLGHHTHGALQQTSRASSTQVSQPDMGFTRPVWAGDGPFFGGGGGGWGREGARLLNSTHSIMYVFVLHSGAFVHSV